MQNDRPADLPTLRDAPSGQEAAIAGLRREVEGLRREARTARRLAFAATAGLALGLVAMTNPDVASVIQTKRLEIVDDQGRVTLVAGTSAQGGRLDLWNAGGSNTVRIGSNDVGGDLILWNREGNAVFSAFAQQTGGRAEVGQANGRLGGVIESGPDGGRMSLANAGGAAVAGIGAFADGGAMRLGDRSNGDAAVLQGTGAGGSLALAAESGEVFARLRAVEAGGELDLATSEATRRVHLSTSPEESVVMVASDRGASRLLGNGSGGALDIMTSDGDRIVSLESNETGGHAVFRSLGNEAVASVGASPAEGTGGLLQLYNSDQQPVFAAAVNGEGAGRLALGTSAGSASLIAESGKEDGSSISLLRGGKRLLAMLAGSNGGLLNLFTADGTPIWVAGNAQDGTGGVTVIRSEAGKDLVRIGVDEKGSGNVVLFNRDASERKTVAGPR